MVRVRAGIAVVASAALVLALASGTSSASTGVGAKFTPQPGDVTYVSGPMTLTVPAYPTFVAATTTNIVNFCPPGPPLFSQAEVTVAWKASSTAAPIANYSVTPLTWLGVPETPYATKATSLKGWVGNYTGLTCGGNGDVIGWQITAVDTKGNTVSAEVQSFPEFTRFDDSSVVSVFPLGTWSYSGTWAVSNCLCADGGRQTYSKQKNASASFAFSDLFLGRHISLVMAEGPGRGSAAVYLDGVLKATINTHATINTNRVITWDSGALTVGNHTVKIVNLATSGHPRIDINAAITQGD
jgi:hypothetical protein